jgi:hypothetical protein
MKTIFFILACAGLIGEVQYLQKKSDLKAWKMVILDAKEEPVYLVSTNGKFKIGPVYVRTGTKWERIQ